MFQLVKYSTCVVLSTFQRCLSLLDIVAWRKWLNTTLDVTSYATHAKGLWVEGNG